MSFQSFSEFWRFYIAEHSNPLNRRLHVAGTAAALGVALLGVVTRRPKLLLLAPLVGYAPAWIGHFVVERNRPATLGNPLWSLRADLRMLALTATGRIHDELRRQGIVGETKRASDRMPEPSAGRSG